MNFSIEIASVADRDTLVAEIWFGKKMVAELQKKSDYVIQIYGSNSPDPWAFNLDEWISVLTEAKKRLGPT